MRKWTITAAAIALAALSGGCERKAEKAEPAAEQAPQKGLDRSHSGSAMPEVDILNPDGGTTNLSAMKGVPTLVNLWATWCAPCVKELPTLDKLAASHRIDGALGVLAVSQDMGPQASVKAFLEDHKITDLGAFQDPEMKLTSALNVQVMPTTILYDGAGKEVWRYVGDLDWTGAEAAKLLSEAGPSRPDVFPPPAD